MSRGTYDSRLFIGRLMQDLHWSLCRRWPSLSK